MQRKILTIALCALAAAACRLPAHEHHAPHGGSLQVLGEEFAHIELVLDSGTGRLSAFILDGEAEEPVRISQKALRIHLFVIDVTLSHDRPAVQKVGHPQASRKLDLVLKAVANDLTGESVGDTSQFEAADRRLKGVSAFSGTLADVTVRGTRFRNVRLLHPRGNEALGDAKAGGAGRPAEADGDSAAGQPASKP